MNKVIEELFTLRPEKNYGCANMEKFSKLLGHPDRAYKTVHIAGSNGKGTAATKIAKGLMSSGFRVGLYTSPHIISFGERIIVNEKQIPLSLAARGIQNIRALAKKHNIPEFFFDIATMLAFDYFRTEAVDIAVIETGLGGEYDSTNIITPVLSVITSIDLEHTHVLGNTLDEIAEKKAGIIKPGVPVVLGPQVNFHPITKKAQLVNAPIHYAEDSIDIARVALQLLDAPQRAIEIGLAANPPCRFEVITSSSGEPVVIIDIAHNPSALKHLFARVKRKWPEKTLHVLYGISHDKEIEQCLSIVAGQADHIHLYKKKSDALVDPHMLKEILEEKGCETVSVDSFEQAVEAAAEKEAILIITGSFYLIGELYHLVNGWIERICPAEPV